MQISVKFYIMNFMKFKNSFSKFVKINDFWKKFQIRKYAFSSKLIYWNYHFQLHLNWGTQSL